jgi:hypothetical protein
MMTGLDGIHRYKAFFTDGTHYVLHNVLILKAIHMTFCMMNHSSPFTGDQTARKDTRPSREEVNKHSFVLSLSLLPFNQNQPMFVNLNVESSENMTLSHGRSTLLSANVTQHNFMFLREQHVAPSDLLFSVSK